MRKFGNDAPEFMEFMLGDSEEVYKLPLAGSLPMETLIEMQEAVDKGETAAMRFQLELLRRYIGDAASTLNAVDVRDIYKEWTKESASQGAEAGE